MQDDTKKVNQVLTFTTDESNSVGGIAVTENFALLLRHYRTKVKDLSLKQLEELSQINASYLSRLERGEKNAPSLPILIRIVECLGIPYPVLISTIFQGVESKKKPSISDVLIQSNFALNNRELSKEARSILISINEFMVDCKWNADTKVKELYMLSEMLDEFKAAI